MSLPVYDRHRRTVIPEPQFGERRLRFLYRTWPGRLLLKAIFARPWYSELSAAYDRTSYSTRKIAPFVARYHIALDEYPGQHYASFADFITRRIDPARRPIAPAPALIAVADAKLLVYHITAEGRIPVKHAVYSIVALLRDEQLARAYVGGTCLVFRLSADDYHRYCFCDDGTVKLSRDLPGWLHTVQPIGESRAYIENHRRFDLIATKHFGDMVVVEVGALLVGKIHDHQVREAQRGQEKGYFALGGSSIVLLFAAGAVTLDADILEQSAQGIETRVRLGEKIGAHA